MKNFTLTLTESEIRDIRKALINAMVTSNNGGERFMELRDKILDQQKNQKEA